MSTGMSVVPSKQPHPSKSSRSSPLQQSTIGLWASEINRRDEKGRTVLHLVVSSLDAEMTDWREIILSSITGVQVNLADEESGWTALHRALYSGNLLAARELLKRSDIDSSIKDHEGLTAFDLYNSLIDGTNPQASDLLSDARAELFTWGSNRNITLGFEDNRDRVFPERINLSNMEELSGYKSFESVRVRQVELARLHSAIITDEPRNFRMCGFGTGGRLGVNNLTQFTFAPLSDFPFKVVHASLSPDHTLLVTDSGECYTFGLGRFQQLGYVIDTGSSTTASEPIQLLPKRVLGALKKEFVIGGSCSRSHSLVFTSSNSVYTFGTNRGQLGYSPEGGAIQVLPRKVTTLPEIAIVASSTSTESASALLLASGDVLLLFKEHVMKIDFTFSSSSPRPSRMQTSSKPKIVQISSFGSTFAGLSSLGEIFTFDTSNSSTELTGFRASPKTRKIWSQRRKFTSPTSIAVGMEGTIILSTVAGHVYVGNQKSSNDGGGGNHKWKFTKISNLQRITQVKASNGGFGAIRVDVPLGAIVVVGETLSDSFLKILPHWSRISKLPVIAAAPQKGKGKERYDEYDVEDEEIEQAIEEDVKTSLRLLQVIEFWNADWMELINGADMYIVADGVRIPVHRIIVSRSNYLQKRCSNLDSDIFLPKCSLFSALLLIHYLYTDDSPAVWDSRVSFGIRKFGSKFKINSAQVKTELIMLAELLELPALLRSIKIVKSIPTPLLATHFSAKNSLFADVVLVLPDGEVLAHSTILRARVPFFSTLFNDSDWTRERKVDGRYRFNFEFSSQAIKLVLEFAYRDSGIELFEDSRILSDSIDDYLDFVFSILSASNYFMLDKLKLVCSVILRKFITLQTVASILSEAAHFEAEELVSVAINYIKSNLETILQQHLLDDFDIELVVAVQAQIQASIANKFPISRSSLTIFLAQELFEKHASWLSNQDYGKRTGGYRKSFIKSVNAKTSPVISPTLSPIIQPRSSQYPSRYPSPLLSPTLEPLHELFEMDDFQLDSKVVATSPVLRWNQPLSAALPKTAPTIDLRSIMESQKSIVKPRVLNESTPRRASAPLTWRPTGESSSSISLARIQSEQARPKATISTSPIAPVPRSFASPLPPPSSAATVSPIHNIITPARLPSRTGTPTGGSRGGQNSSGTVPWTNFTPPPPAVVQSLPNSSFLSIQSAQLQQNERVVAGKSVRSLLSIQNEEFARQAQEDAALKEEIAFSVWWNEETLRVAAESNRTSESNRSGSKRGGKKPRGRGGKSETTEGKGKGRGGGGGSNRGKPAIAALATTSKA